MGQQETIVAVLAGGSGRRLGGRKAMAALGGRPLIFRPLAAAHAAGLETIVLAKRTTELPPLGEQVIHEPEHPRHPLCGVVGALEFAAARSPAPAVLLLACDMPFLTGPMLAWLAGLEGPAMVEAGGRPQPLMSRCVAEQLPELRQALAKRRSLAATFEALAPRIVTEPELAPFGDPELLCFNVNSDEDLRSAERLIAGERDA